jgi:hypothetical protein
VPESRRDRVGLQANLRKLGSDAGLTRCSISANLWQYSFNVSYPQEILILEGPGKSRVRKHHSFDGYHSGHEQPQL